MARAITFRELAAQIATWTDEQQDSDVTIYDENLDEFFVGAFDFVTDGEIGDGILDEGHPYMCLQADEAIDEESTDYLKAELLSLLWSESQCAENHILFQKQDKIDNIKKILESRGVKF